MLILAIDSSNEIATLAIGDEKGIISELHFKHSMDLLRRIAPQMEQLLYDCGKQVTDLDGVVVSLGPGSFTGLRIGISVAKSLAYALKIPITGIPTPDALAFQALPGFADFICPMIFARADEVYWALYDAINGEAINEIQVSTIDEALSEAISKGGKIAFCGTGVRKNSDYFADANENIIVLENWMDFARGAALIKLGINKLQQGSKEDAFNLVPLYVKKPTPVVKLLERS